MTKEVIDRLPSELSKTKTLKRISEDTTNHEIMIDSLLRVVDFDKVSKEYGHRFQVPRQPKTNDALYISQENRWFFIEFKNGRFKESDLYRKIYDSLIMVSEFGFINWNFCRQNIEYILVYNEEVLNKDYASLQQSDSRLKLHNRLREHANSIRNLYGIDKLQGYLFNETHTYNEEQFKEYFVDKFEAIEGL